ncbi:diguanylate cyclase [Shewanella indica]|uniref:diguanylate cyclase n=2 Tax=Shewanella indica TaxID=768528 RepID=A0ABU4QBD5_9GAMM|nr:diguanylate cyclase [Shewanella indica]MDX6015550.1 diguanylate cyclase [Shewanella indica]
MELRYALLCLFLLLTSLKLFALEQVKLPVINIERNSVALEEFKIGYFIDNSQNLGFEQARQKPFGVTDNVTTLGTNARVTWFKLILHNRLSQEKPLLLHLPHAYHVQQIDIYEESGQQLQRHEQLDLEQAADNPLMYRGTVVYPLTLAPDQITTLYIRSHAYSHQWFAMTLMDGENSRRALVSTHYDIALMVGMLLALVFYNCLLYFASSKKENIYYSLYLISGLVWIALSYGLVASVFNAYGSNVFMLNLSLLTMPIFLLLFMTAIFETRQFYPTEHKVLQLLLLLLFAILIWGLFDISAALKPASSMAAVMMLVTFSVSISLYRKGNPLVKYFLVGHSFFVIFNGIAVLFYKGLISPSYLSSHGVGIGIMLEALTLAFIISYRIKILEDIRASQEELKRQAATDPLTKLYNRRYFYSEADYQLKLAGRNGEAISVLILDIDSFKQINDNFGHHLGDRVIVALAKLLKQHCQGAEMAARFGGEEFVILLPGATLNQALHRAEQLRLNVEAMQLTADTGDKISCTISLGVAEVEVATESIEAAVKRADHALYQAKNSGRNRVVANSSASDQGLNTDIEINPGL